MQNKTCSMQNNNENENEKLLQPRRTSTDFKCEFINLSHASCYLGNWFHGKANAQCINPLTMISAH